MKVLPAAALIAFAAAVTAAPLPPKAGKVEILKASDIKPGMHAVAWTVFQGTVPEPVPIESGHHSRQDGRQGEGDQRGRRHERQPGLH